MRNDKENLIVNLTLDFSESLHSKNKYEMASQIFRSGTSIGVNIREAENAESKEDFIYKFKISAKEIDELYYWLILCKKSKYYPNPSITLLEDLEKILKIVSSSKKKL